MTNSLSVLTKLPDAFDFYKNYWNKKPFVVKNAIRSNILSNLISPEELAGLSLEEDVRSRIVTKGQKENEWTCEHGPFDEDIYNQLGEENWSLLVQRVEQYHDGTKAILSEFGFSPCWLIDDIMVSFSVAGGGVGPHLDSYHVFLVQGKGERIWKVGNAPEHNEKYITNLDLKILEDDFIHTEITVGEGDVIYIPPYYPHEGKTIEDALTYSIGFLGPSTSELLIEFGHYLEEQEILNNRYTGGKLNETSSGDNMAEQEVDNFRDTLVDVIQSPQFETWLKSYFVRSYDD